MKGRSARTRGRNSKKAPSDKAKLEKKGQASKTWWVINSGYRRERITLGKRERISD